MKKKLSEFKNYEIFQGERALRLLKRDFVYDTPIHIAMNKAISEMVLDGTVSVLIDRDTNNIYNQLTEVLIQSGLL